MTVVETTHHAGMLHASVYAATFFLAVMAQQQPCCLPDPFRVMETWRKTMEPQKPELPRVWTRGRKETESRQRASGAKSP